MKHKILSFLIVLSLLPTISLGQIKISETIKASNLASDRDNALYFIDFWATWCGPCITASKQLAHLQRQYSSNFYIMSLTKESPSIVKNFMNKHNIDLAVAIDHYGETFSKYKVTSLPYGVLLNADGETLWEGHPAELKSYHLDSYLGSNTKKISLDKMFEQQTLVPVFIPKEDDLKKDFEILKLDTPVASLQVLKKEKFIEMTGSLQDILAYINNVYRNQISINQDINHHYVVRFIYNTNAFDEQEKVVLKQLKLRKKDAVEKGEVLLFNLDNAQFWDINQIDWGRDTPPFLIGDSEIKGDNVSLPQLNYQLSNILELPIVTTNNELANEPHDWNVHYKYFELMTSGFIDSYGIKVEKLVSEYPKYIITSRRASR